MQRLDGRAMGQRWMWSGLGVCLLAGVALACSSGGSSPSGVTITVDPSFEKAATGGGPLADTVTLEVGPEDGGRIFLDLFLWDVSEPVSGVAIKLSYPSDISKFISCRDGDLFAPGSCFEEEPDPGEVFLSRTIVAPEAPADVVGGRWVLRIEFLVFEVGEGAIVFEGQNLGGGDASAILDASGDPILIEWFAGTIKGQ